MSQSSGSKQLTVTKKANVLDKGSRTKATAASNNNGNGSDNSGGGGGGGGTGVSVSSWKESPKRDYISSPLLAGTRTEGCPG